MYFLSSLVQSGEGDVVTTVVIAPAAVESGANCTVTTVLEANPDVEQEHHVNMPIPLTHS